MLMLNLGSGPRFCNRPDWINIDLDSTSDKVISHDLLESIPFPDQTFDAVYHSHVLEHFTRDDGVHLIKECFRVLKHGGIIRVVVPDLENITRLYITALEKSLEGNRQWQYNYEWLKLEMYDQTIRERSGGKMMDFLHQTFIPLS